MAKPAKKKSSPLTKERIEEVALRLVEEVGLEDLSMRRLGQALRVEAMSLYHHFPSKNHLLDALLDRVMAQIEWPDDALPWRTRIERSLLSWRATLRRYPRLSQRILVHRMNTPVALAVLERAVRPFHEAAGPREAAIAFRTMGYYLTGAILEETAGYARGPTAAEPLTLDEQRAIAPGVIKMGPFFASAHWDEIFERGLAVLLDAFEAKVGGKRSR